MWHDLEPLRGEQLSSGSKSATMLYSCHGTNAVDLKARKGGSLVASPAGSAFESWRSSASMQMCAVSSSREASNRSAVPGMGNLDELSGLSLVVRFGSLSAVAHLGAEMKPLRVLRYLAWELSTGILALRCPISRSLFSVVMG